MEFGEVMRIRSARCFFSNNRGHGYVDFKAQKDHKGKFTQNMLLMNLGVEDIGAPLTGDQIKNRLKMMGWREMTDAEYKEFRANMKGEDVANKPTPW